MGSQRDKTNRSKHARQAVVQRQTSETDITLKLNLDGSGNAQVATGVGFFDHMLNLLAKHSLFDLELQARGDLDIDQHHTVEDVGICFGQALDESLRDRSGIHRFGDATVPMDEALVSVAVDLSGRPFLVWKASIPTPKIGTFDSQLVEEFWRAAATSARMNFHVMLHHGQNAHHIAEAVFKGAARALANAVASDPRVSGVPSTKGKL